VFTRKAGERDNAEIADASATLVGELARFESALDGDFLGGRRSRGRSFHPAT
jgi:hypothetical protein